MLYIMRHGKTDWNILRKIQGQTDIPLNEEGRRMAWEAGKKYQKVHFDICYCSPLSRASETAALFLEGREVPVIYDERLREMSFGVCEGMNGAEEGEDCPIRILFQNPELYTPAEGGETFQELFARTGSFLDELVRPELKTEKDILIIGHGAMNSSIICQIKEIPLEHFWNAGIENCKLMKLC